MRPTTRMALTMRRGGSNYGDVYRSDRGYPPMDRYDMEPTDRFRDRRGREHYDNGRFAPMRNGLEIEGDVVFNRVPPVYRPEEGYRYNGDDRMIGFYGGGRDELAERREQLRHGRAEHHARPMDRQTAQMWVRGMHNADGSTGEHWSYDQTTQLMRQKGIDCDPAEFYAAINMLWSDYGMVAKKTGQDNADYWAEMAKAFLSDKDANPDKLSLYREYIAKK